MSTKPKILTPIERSNEARADMQWQFVKQFAWQCCFNCEEFNKETAQCKLNGNQVPPPQIILLGCKDHITDIPF